MSEAAKFLKLKSQKYQNLNESRADCLGLRMYKYVGRDQLNIDLMSVRRKMM